MANLHNSDERKYQRFPLDQRYMVDSGKLYDISLYQGIPKKEREMITQIAIWLWYGAGMPCLVVSFCAFVFKFEWVHIGDVKGFVTIMIAVITGISKVIIMWAEKGDIVREKWNRLIKRRKLKP